MNRIKTIKQKMRAIYKFFTRQLNYLRILFKIAISWIVLIGEKRIIIKKIDLESDQSTASKSRKVCLFSHFDSHNLVDLYVIHLIKGIREQGFDIHFITTVKELKESEVKKLLPFCTKIIHMRNLGRDFGAWKVGLSCLDLEKVDNLLLANDSIYGPLKDLGYLFKEMNSYDCDFWGITDSWETAYHIQSYFLLLKETILRSDIFLKFWSSYRLINDKYYAINRGEIYFSQLLLRRNFKAKVFCPYHKLLNYVDFTSMIQDRKLKSRKSSPDFSTFRNFTTNLEPEQYRLLSKPCNPTHYFWQILVEKLDCPFIKVELLRKNPSEIYSAVKWREVVYEISAEMEELIHVHLSRFVKNRVP